MDSFAMFVQCDEMEDKNVLNSIWDEFFSDSDECEIQKTLLFKEDYKRPFHISLSELCY